MVSITEVICAEDLCFGMSWFSFVVKLNLNLSR